MENDTTSTMSNEMDKQHSNSEESFTTHEIEGTPFLRISQGEQHFAVLGQERVTEVYDNPSRVIEDAQQITWNKLLVVVNRMIQHNNETHNLTVTE